MCVYVEYSISIEVITKLKVQLVDVMQVKVGFGRNPGHGSHIYASVPQYNFYGKSDLYVLSHHLCFMHWYHTDFVELYRSTNSLCLEQI